MMNYGNPVDLVVAVLLGTAMAVVWLIMVLPPNFPVFWRRYLQTSAGIMVTVVIAALLTGCATTRTIRVNDQKQTVAMTHGGPDHDRVKVGFWGALWEPWVEEQSTRVAQESWRRQEGSVYHDNALQAAKATRVSEPYVEAPPLVSMSAPVDYFDRPINARPINPLPSTEEKAFSRYEEDPAPEPVYQAPDYSAEPVLPERVRVRQAVRSGLMELPLAGQEGGRPVVFINDGRNRARQFIVWQEGSHSPQYEVNVPAGGRTVRYLQLGRHFVEVLDQNGRPQRIRDPHRDVYRQSYSYRWRDRSWDYTGAFDVTATPSFIDESGNQYFGIFRAY